MVLLVVEEWIGSFDDITPAPFVCYTMPVRRLWPPRGLQIRQSVAVRGMGPRLL